MSTSELCTKIFDLCELVCCASFYPYQRQVMLRIIRSVLENDGEDISILQARQSGKSFAVSGVVAGLMVALPLLANIPMFAADKRLDMFKKGFFCICFAPIAQQATIIFSGVKKNLKLAEKAGVLSDPDINLYFSTSNGTTVSLSNGSVVMAMTASDTSNIEGESAMLLVTDESQHISERKYNVSIRPMAAAYNGTKVMIGTSRRAAGFFYKTIQRNKQEAENGKTLHNHYEYDYLVASKYNERYAKYVEGEKRKLGEDSTEFKVSYKLEWVKELSLFLDIAKFEDDNTEPLLDLLLIGEPNKTYVAGVDVGGKHDSTVVCIGEVDWSMPVIDETRFDTEVGAEVRFTAYNTYVRGWLELTAMDYNDQYFAIMEYLDLFNPVRVVFDATRERSLCDRVAANRDADVIPFVFGSVTKSALYKHFDTEVSSHRFRIAYDESARETPETYRFMRQLGDLERSYRGGLLCVSHPDTATADGIPPHDDFPDAASLMCWAAKEPTSSAPVQNKNIFNALSRRSNVTHVLHSLRAKRR